MISLLQVNNLGKTYTHLHKGCLWSRDFHLPLPTGVAWEYTEGKPELSPTLSSATLPSITPPSLLPAGAQKVSGPQPPGTNEHLSASLWDGVLRGCLGRHGFYPLQLRKGTWCLVYYFYNALWIYNYLKTEKVKKRRNTFIKFWNCCSKLSSNKILCIFLSNVKWRLTHRKYIHICSVPNSVGCLTTYINPSFLRYCVKCMILKI